MIQKKHLCWMVFVEIVFLLVNLVVEGNYLIGLQLYSNSAASHADQEKYRLGSYLFTAQMIKFHFIIIAILTDLLMVVASFCQLRLLVIQPLHMFIHRIQSANQILIAARIVLGIAEHIQDSSSFDQNSIQIACNQSTAGQSNQGCNLLFGRTLLLAFIYISEFFVLASLISFRYYYKIYLREPAIDKSSKLGVDLLQQEQSTQQQQASQFEKNAALISVELSEKTEHQENLNSLPSIQETANSVRLKQMYLTNRVLHVDTKRISSTQSSPLQKQFAVSGMSNVSPGETLTTSLSHSPLTKSSTLKSKKQRESMPSLLTNPVFTVNAKTSFTQSLQGGQKPFSLLLQSARGSQLKNSNNSNQFQTNSSDSGSNSSQPQSPTLELGLKKGISEKVREEESEEDDPRFVPNTIFRTETNKKIPPLALVPSTVIVGHGVAKASSSILANAISTSIGTSVGSEIVEAAASPFRAIFSKVFNSFLNKK